jgi:hypothetical protein
MNVIFLAQMPYRMAHMAYVKSGMFVEEVKANSSLPLHTPPH